MLHFFSTTPLFSWLIGNNITNDTVITLDLTFYLSTLFLLFTSLVVLSIFLRPRGPMGLPLIGHHHLLRPIAHRSLHGLSSRHGPLLRLRLGSIPCIVAASPELAGKFLKTNELAFFSRKHSAAVHRLTYGSNSFPFAPYGPYWKFVKKLCMNDMLGTRARSHFRSVRSRELYCFVRRLMDKEVAGEAVNLSQELLKLTNKFISQMMLGTGSSTEDMAEAAREVVREVREVLGEFDPSDFV